VAPEVISVWGNENVFLIGRKRILRTRTSPIAILLVEIVGVVDYLVHIDFLSDLAHHVAFSSFFDMARVPFAHVTSFTGIPLRTLLRKGCCSLCSLLLLAAPDASRRVYPLLLPASGYTVSLLELMCKEEL
jgi:hypothetical protein